MEIIAVEIFQVLPKAFLLFRRPRIPLWMGGIVYLPRFKNSKTVCFPRRSPCSVTGRKACRLGDGSSRLTLTPNHPLIRCSPGRRDTRIPWMRYGRLAYEVIDIRNISQAKAHNGPATVFCG